MCQSRLNNNIFSKNLDIGLVEKRMFYVFEVGWLETAVPEGDCH